jgi:6-phosphogluconolactonase
MADKKILANVDALAEVAVKMAVVDLKQAVDDYGSAVWVIAGGSSPMVAYRWLAQHAADALDWSKVSIVIGDERCVPFDSPDSNWAQALQAFAGAVQFSPQSLRPSSDQSAEVAAAGYGDFLRSLPQTAAGLPRFDHVWLGVGEDGHTLSLFPGHPALLVNDRLVVAVHDSPKPPPDRISLTFGALRGAAHCVVVAAGAAKASVIARALNGDQSLPVAQAVTTVESAGGRVTWLLDTAAAAD